MDRAAIGSYISSRPLTRKGTEGPALTTRPLYAEVYVCLPLKRISLSSGR